MDKVSRPSSSSSSFSSISICFFKQTNSSSSKLNRWRRTRLFAKTVSAIESVRHSSHKRELLPISDQKLSTGQNNHRCTAIDLPEPGWPKSGAMASSSVYPHSKSGSGCSVESLINTRTASNAANTGHQPLSATSSKKTGSSATSPISPSDKIAPTAPIIQLESQPISLSSSCSASVATQSIAVTSVARSARRSLESELVASSSVRNIGSPNRSGGASPQASHCPSLSDVLSSRASIERAILLASAGSHQIPDNHNTTLINQLNKNYLKSICKQNKARNDWKSLKAKLTALRRRDSGEKADSAGGQPAPSSSASTSATGLQQSLPVTGSTTLSSKRGSFETSGAGANMPNTSCSTIDTAARKMTSQDEGIICRKEDLIRLLQSATPTKQGHRKPLKSISDVVLQLRSDGHLSSSSDTSRKGLHEPSEKVATATTESTANAAKPNKMTAGDDGEPLLNAAKVADETMLAGSKVETVDSIETTASKSSAEENLIVLKDEYKGEARPLLKSTLSTGNGSRGRSSTAGSNQSTVRKKKVKIVDTDQHLKTKVSGNGGRSGFKDKGLAVRKTGSNSSSDSARPEVASDETEQAELEERLRRECLQDDSNGSGNETVRSLRRNAPKSSRKEADSGQEPADEENPQLCEKSRVKWDEGDVVDATALGDAIQAFLRGISSSSTEKKVSFKTIKRF